MPFKYESMRDRIKANVKATKAGCWVWKARTNNDGYGVVSVRVNGRHLKEYAHRIAYREWKGEIPKGKEVSHKCHNERCCNPQHLIAETHRQNMRRGAKDKRA